MPARVADDTFDGVDFWYDVNTFKVAAMTSFHDAKAQQ